MVTATSTVNQVMGTLFERPFARSQDMSHAGGQGRGGGRQGGRSSPARAQILARAVERRPSAVMKLIKRGGCVNRAGLKGQLEYVFSKADAIMDPYGEFEHQDSLSNADMNRITRSWEQDWWGSARAGYTSHILLSYPVGTSVEDVREISKAVCEEMFQSGDAHYDYVAGLHTDRDHPHVHVIVNRRGTDNRLLTIRAGTEMSYEGFRESMVAHAERRGVYLDNSSRFERGIVSRAPDTREIYQAREEGRAPEDRPRVGDDLKFAIERINENAVLYSAISVLAENEGLTTVQRACERAGALLTAQAEQGISAPIEKGVITEEVNRSEAEAFDGALAQLSANLETIREGIAEAHPLHRPGFEKQYVEIQAGLSGINPTAPDTQLLHSPSSQSSPYGPDYIRDPDALDKDDTRNTVAGVLQGTGIDTDEMIERMKLTAEREYLEQRWALNDLQSIANTKGFDLQNSAEFAQALDALNETYADMRFSLVELDIANDHQEVVEEADLGDDVRRGRRPALLSDQDGLLSRFSMAQPVERDELVAQLRGYYGDEYDQIEHEIENHLDELTGDPDEQAVIAFVVHNDRYDRGLEPSSERVSSLRSEAARAITQHRASQHGDDGLEHE